MLDLSGVEASSGKPKGKFTLRVLSAKQTKSQAGENMIKMELCIVGEKFSKYRLYEVFMLEGKGASIGMGRLADLMDKIDIPRTLDDMSPFLNKLVDADILEDKKSGYSKISGYHKATTQENSGEEF